MSIGMCSVTTFPFQFIPAQIFPIHSRFLVLVSFLVPCIGARLCRRPLAPAEVHGSPGSFAIKDSYNTNSDINESGLGIINKKKKKKKKDEI